MHTVGFTDPAVAVTLTRTGVKGPAFHFLGLLMKSVSGDVPSGLVHRKSPGFAFVSWGTL